MSKPIQYTIQSTNEDDYGTIETCLEAPASPYTNLTITGLTTLCSMILLDKSDFIEVNNERYFVTDCYSDLNSVSLASILTDILVKYSKRFPLKASVDSANRICFNRSSEKSTSNIPFEEEEEEEEEDDSQEEISEFEITNASYNMKLLTGLYNVTFPIASVNFEIRLKSVGLYQSTPILYLISNIGSQCYQNRNRTYCDQKIVMRIYNSFAPNLPIVCNNAEFTTLVNSNALGNVWFRLVDANFHPIKLLSPMHLSASGIGIELLNNQDAESPL